MLLYQLVASDKSISLPSQLGKYKCLLLIERVVEDGFRNQLSRSLVDSGCLHAMAWGLDCSLWDDSVDYANIEKFGDGGIPDDQLVMTTWHTDDSLEDVVRFAKIDAIFSYTDEPLTKLLVLDLRDESRAEVIEELFNRVG